MFCKQSILILFSFALLLSTGARAEDERSSSVSQGAEDDDSSYSSPLARQMTERMLSNSKSRSELITTDSPDVYVNVPMVRTKGPQVEVVVEAPKTTSTPKVAPTRLPATIVETGHDDDEPTHKFCDYMKPVCDSMNLIGAKHVNKIQSQLRQLVHLSDGKLGSCFEENYSFNPAATVMTKDDLLKMCLAKNITGTSKGSYKAFQICAVKHWTPAVDKELDKIQSARADYLKTHQHHVNSTSAMLTHENEEVKIISDVVNNVLTGDNKTTVADSSTIRVVDLSTPKVAQVTTMAPLAEHVPATNVANNEQKVVLNDPNTVVVFVDESKTTAAPSLAPKVESAPADKVPHLINIITNNATTLKPLVSDNQTVKVESVKPLLINGNLLTTTLAPKALEVKVNSSEPLKTLLSTSKPDLVVTVQASSTSKPIVAAVTVQPTKAAVVNGNATTPSATSPAPAKTTTAPKSSTTTGAPKVDDKEKQLASEKKLKEDRDSLVKQLKKKQDELDALNAMKSLQAQRSKQSPAQHTDSRLHQLEHHRQMSIDPIGHMIKHQQYENQKLQQQIG